MVNDVMKFRNLVVPAVALVAIAGCAGNAVSPPGATTVVSPSSAKAQLAVGTANLFGTSTGMNVVATMRTPSGSSVLLSTPTLTGPFALPAAPGTKTSTGATIADGPSASEIATGGVISGTPQVAPGTPMSQIPATTFGIAGGLFANGFIPANADNLGVARVTPYTQPLYAQADVNKFVPLGGPPAFDPNGNGEGTRDGTFDPSVLGVYEGLNIFAGVTPKTGAYALNVVIPSNAGNTTISASANLPAIVALATVTAPTFVPDGNGGGSFAVSLPAGVTDALVSVTDIGATDGKANCHLGNPGTAYYTIHATASGTLALPDSDGPRTATSPFTTTPTICTAAQNSAVGNTSGGDMLTVQLIGADYPLYASNYLFNLTSQLPAIVGPNGTDDITVSALAAQTSS